VRRPLLVVAALFGGGCLLGARPASAGDAALLTGLSASLLILAGLCHRQRAAAVAVASAAIGLGAAAATIELLRFESGDLRRLLRPERDGGAAGADGTATLRLVGTVRGDAFERNGRVAATLDVEGVDRGGRVEPLAGRVRLEIGGATPGPLEADGRRLAVWARLRASGPDAARDGVAAYGYCKSSRLVEVLGPGRIGPVRRAAARVRAWARAAIARHMCRGSERGLVLAMVIGDRSEIDESTSEAFRASGTYHVLALSGAQVALVAGLLVAALRRSLASPWLQACATTAVVAFYAALVGGDVPVVRAALMSAAVLSGRALEVDADAANLLGLAALLLLLDRPSCILDVGFQLSFAATLGILGLSGPLARGVPRLPLRIDSAVAASLAAQAALMPILAASFHRLAPAALLLNLAAVPLSSAVLLAGLALVGAAALGDALASPLAAAAWISARALRVSGDLGPLAPWLDVRVPGPSPGTIACHLAALALLARGRRGPGLALLAVVVATLVALPGRPEADGRLHLHVVDVGQGDGLVLRSAGGRALLVDAGGSRDPRFDPGERRLAPFLWARGVRSIDALLVTHAHPDHVGGVPFLLQAFRVAELWEGPAPLRDPSWRRVQAELSPGPARRTLAAGMRFEWEGARLEVLGPPRPRHPPLRVRNEDSVVLDVGYGEVHLLLTGDVTGDLERQLAAGPAAVLKIPHHGSRSSSSPAFVAAVQPRVAVASAGAHNPFGHPSPDVLERYRRAGALVLRTDLEGDVEIATDGRRLWVRTRGECQERRIR
jgi:competence protein ComEC